nr:hypothetical protein [Sinirhodobacter populi]
MSGQLINLQAQGQDPGQIAVKRQLEAVAPTLRRNRRRDDLPDQAPGRLSGLALVVGFGQAAGQSANAVLPGIGHLRMDAGRRRRGRGGGQVLFQLLLPCGQLLHLRLDPFWRGARQKRVHQNVLFPDDLGQISLLDRPIIDMGGGKAVALGDVFGGEDLDEFGIHQPLGQDRQDPALQLLPGDAGAIAADRGALVAGVRAAEPVLADRREAAPAAAAFDQAWLEPGQGALIPCRGSPNMPPGGRPARYGEMARRAF